jgi:pyroglutamyl-peptidase
MQTILITSFGRFPGSPVDPSGPIATRLAQRRRPASAGTRRIAHVFAVTAL